MDTLQNVKSLEGWIASLVWLANALNDYKLDWKYSNKFKIFYKALNKTYKEEPDERLPFTLDDVIKYTKFCKVIPGNYNDVDFNKLLEITVLQSFTSINSHLCCEDIKGT